MPMWVEISVSVLLVVAGIFGLVGSFGLIRLGDAMSRLHAPTKATTLGVGSVLIASMLWFFAADGTISAHELMITLFLFLTAPITAHFIAKVHLHLREKPGTLPRLRDDVEWAGFAASAPERGVRVASDEGEHGR